VITATLNRILRAIDNKKISLLRINATLHDAFKKRRNGSSIFTSPLRKAENMFTTLDIHANRAYHMMIAKNKTVYIDETSEKQANYWRFS